MVSTRKSASPALKLLILSSFLMSLGFYSLIPYLAVHFTTRYHWTVTAAGLLLATRQLSQQGLTFVGGAIADRVGWHRTMVIGICMRAAGFLAFAFSSEPVPAFAAAAFSTARCLG